MSRHHPFVDVAIIGGGPCGMGAAWRIEEHRRAGRLTTYLLAESQPTLGGTAASITTAEGFTFDFGGHILYPHSNYAAFGAMVDALVEDWDESAPVRGVFHDGTLIPYPVQQNIHRLPLRTFVSSVAGLAAVNVRRRLGISPVVTGDEPLLSHLRRRFGTGLSRHVMEPLNAKMWATSPADMSSAWTGHRSGSKTANVADVSLLQVAVSALTHRDRPGWAGAKPIRYPSSGGTGAIWAELAKHLTAENVRTGSGAVAIDAEAHLLRLSTGETVRYGQLISTMPLDRLAGMVGITGTSGGSPLHYANASFVGLGLSGAPPAWLRGVHSFHLPDPAVPCWRVSFPASLAAGNAPNGNHWSILCEISHTNGMDYDLEAANVAIEAHLRRLYLIPGDSRVVSRWLQTLEHGYPVPFLGRDQILAGLHARLDAHDIYSRGRFGGWKYEVSNMDHTFMQGVEAVDSILAGEPETTYRMPALIN